MTTQPTDDDPTDDQSADEVDQDSESTNMAPPGERPTDPGPIAEAADDRRGED